MEQKNITVSLIVPIYNEASHLKWKRVISRAISLVDSFQSVHIFGIPLMLNLYGQNRQ